MEVAKLQTWFDKLIKEVQGSMGTRANVVTDQDITDALDVVFSAEGEECLFDGLQDLVEEELEGKGYQIEQEEEPHNGNGSETAGDVELDDPGDPEEDDDEDDDDPED